MAQKSVPGKKVVFGLFALALLLAFAVFWVGLREKHRRLSGRPKAPETVAVTAPEIRAALDSLPREWTRISWVRGQGWVIYVPCESPPGVLRLAADSLDRAELICEFCDSLDRASVGQVFRFGNGSLELDLGPLGNARIEPVDDAVAARFEAAPVKKRVLTWKPSPEDSLVFVPTEESGEFETLKAEDESPEGCEGGRL